MTAAASLAGCETLGGLGGADEARFGGAIVADDPAAVTAARDVLGAGGTAADAAVALYFTLAVVLPSTAGLGGGGVCLIKDPDERRPEALDFMPRGVADSDFVPPAAVAGMAALHKRYGHLPWDNLLASAEGLAREGVPVGKSLAHDIAIAGDKLLTDMEVAQIFSGPGGGLLREGETLRQPDLAESLAAIRRGGSGEFYAGELGRRLVAGSETAGNPLTLDSLRATAAAYRDALEARLGDTALFVAPPPAAGGVVTAQIVTMAMIGEYRSASDNDRAHLLAEAGKRAFADRARWMDIQGDARESAGKLVGDDHAEELMKNYASDAATPASAFDPPPQAVEDNPWATGFVVADRTGLTVACAVTLNDLFGTGIIAPGTGVLLAPAPDESGVGAVALGPVMVVDPAERSLTYAASTVGGAGAPAAAAEVLLHTVVEEQPLRTALAAPRLQQTAAPAVVLHEGAYDTAVLGSLRARGHSLQKVGAIGEVNALWCPEGLPDEPESCEAAADPRSNGIAQLLPGPS